MNIQLNACETYYIYINMMNPNTAHLLLWVYIHSFYIYRMSFKYLLYLINSKNSLAILYPIMVFILCTVYYAHASNISLHVHSMHFYYLLLAWYFRITIFFPKLLFTSISHLIIIYINNAMLFPVIHVRSRM